MQEALGTRLDTSATYHLQTDGQNERTIQTLEDMLRAVRYAPFEALYDRKCHSPIMWVEVGEGQLIGPEIVQETTEMISQIKDRLKCHLGKVLYALGRKGKLAPRFVGPFEIIEKVGLVAYRLDFPEELNGVYDTFHVSNLKKRMADPTLKVPLDEIRVDAKLNFAEEPVEILEREFRKLKRSRIAIVKVRWNSKRGPEFTWENIVLAIAGMEETLRLVIAGREEAHCLEMLAMSTDEEIKRRMFLELQDKVSVLEAKNTMLSEDSN
ncbi:putative reverse transcriptase domain-containing protein [Tanacetum coccineum]